MNLFKSIFHLLLVVLSVILYTSCADLQSENIPNQSVFFDLKTFFAQEKSRLSNHPSFTKTIIINGIKEEKQLKQIDLDKDLAIFEQSDINKIAWLDKYQIDSIENGEGVLLQLKYTTLDESLKTKSLAVAFKNGKVEKISIDNQMESSIASSSQNLIYQPTTGYSIENLQDATMGGKNDLKIEVRF